MELDAFNTCRLLPLCTVAVVAAEQTDEAEACAGYGARFWCRGNAGGWSGERSMLAWNFASLGLLASSKMELGKRF